MNDIDSRVKVDLRTINDKVVQRYNQEYEAAVGEAAKDNCGDVKFIGYWYKIILENGRG